ncbi:DEAD/DEAH box helicase [Virgibacillus oceani]
MEEIMELNIDALAQRFSGKLLLRNEIPLDENTFQQMLSAKIFTPTQSIIRNFLSYQCNRCGNQERNLFADIPCQLCHKTYIYCRKCIDMGRVMECEPLYYWSGDKPSWSEHEDPCSWEGELTPKQQQAAERITAAVKMKENELLVWAVCGAGKTEMLFPGITEALKLGMRICIATPRADVVRELKPRLQHAFQQVPVQALYGGSEDKDGTAQLMIATTHQLLRMKEAFDMIVIDEIDAFPFHSDLSLPFAASRAKKPTSTTIYLTATPRKNHQSRIQQKKLPHIFVPVRYHGYALPVPKMKMSFSLQKDLQKDMPPSTLISWLKKRKNQDRQLLIFVPTISLAEKLLKNIAEVLLKERVIDNRKKIDFVHAEDPNRTEKVMQFREKELTVIITTTILERGVTFPSVDVAIFNAGHEVFDEAALVQIAGRAGRSADDPTGEVVFIHDGKTEAMVRAIDAIKQMNKRGGLH